MSTLSQLKNYVKDSKQMSLWAKQGKLQAEIQQAFSFESCQKKTKLTEFKCCLSFFPPRKPSQEKNYPSKFAKMHFKLGQNISKFHKKGKEIKIK